MESAYEHYLQASSTRLAMRVRLTGHIRFVLSAWYTVNFSVNSSCVLAFLIPCDCACLSFQHGSAMLSLSGSGLAPGDVVRPQRGGIEADEGENGES